MSSLAPNIPEFSVSELSNSVRRTLEDRFGLVRVRGEISGFKAYASGHGYFDLKDSDAVIASVMWKGNLQRLGFRPEDGLEVIATGKLSAYPKSSKFQLVVDRMEVAGVGALLKQIEDRRRRLEAEGLFDRASKPPRPFLPDHIGVISSPQGAVIRDILHRLRDRFPRKVTLWPVPVQGDGAAEKIADAIEGFNHMAPGYRPDVLIVARGGGSVEDLMAFNAENVVRAAANSRIPLISAVGHETDTTLIDYASALRAPTPTAAAELAVPVRADLVYTLQDLDMRAARGVYRTRQQKAERLDNLGARLPRPQQLLGVARQRLDEAGDRLPRALSGRVRLKRAELSSLSGRVPRPQLLAQRYRMRLAQVDTRLLPAFTNHLRLVRSRLLTSGARLSPRLLVQGLQRERARLAAPAMQPNLALLHARIRHMRADLNATFRLAESLSPQAVLKRGFVLVRKPDGTLVRTAQEAQREGHLTLQFADAGVPVRVEAPDTQVKAQNGRRKSGSAKDKQGDLF